MEADQCDAAHHVRRVDAGGVCTDMGYKHVRLRSVIRAPLGRLVVQSVRHVSVRGAGPLGMSVWAYDEWMAGFQGIHMPKHMSTHMSKHMPKKMSEHMSTHMSRPSWSGTHV